MAGTEVTCTDVETGESESRTITDGWMVVTDGAYYLASLGRHGNGTVQITLKRRSS